MKTKSKAMRELERLFDTAKTEANSLIVDEAATVEAINAARDKLAGINAKIDTQRLLDAGKTFDDAGDEVKDTTPVNAPHIEVGMSPLFKNFGEQLTAIRNTARGVVDERLVRINNAAAGANTAVGSEGGYLVQQEFAQSIFETAATTGNILSRVDSHAIGDSANGIVWPDIDETSVASSIYGGIVANWVAEGEAAPATNAKWTQKSLRLQKLIGLAYATQEMGEDYAPLSSFYAQAFAEAITRESEAAIVAGTGVGQPLGILKGGGFVTVSKESQQVAATINWENITKVYNRAIKTNRPGLVWLVHPDAVQQLDFLAQVIGSGGVPVYLPAAAVGSVPALKGIPVIESDHCSTLGTAGDIVLADLKQYLWIYKGGVKYDTSIHVKFDTAENAFRFIFRANGCPKKDKALSVKNSNNTRSYYVGIANRA
jgi:HK97 family phage major capsid protein